MNTVFYVLVAILLLGAGAYWWFFMKGQGGKKKVDMTDEGAAQTQQPADMGGEKTSAAPEADAMAGAANSAEGGQDENPSA